jgi:DNA modification methylase/ParB-like chromosome segregation protein Spo0J
MSTLNNNQVVTVNTNDLILNQTIVDLYSTPENFEEMKANIKEFGVIQPILVNRSNKVVISGNLRLQIVRELGYDVVPVIFCELTEDELNIIALSTNIQRKKSKLDIFNEMEFIKKYFNVGQGSRTDLNPQLKEEADRKKSALSGISKYDQDQVKKAKRLSTELFGDSAIEVLKSEISNLDSGKGSINSLVKRLEKQANDQLNRQAVPDSYELNLGDVKVFNHSCEDMLELADKTVTSIVTSPPYFAMRDYGNGESELGLESSRKEYLKNLINIFNECKRVLKDDGSLMVNINEKVENGSYRGVVHQFVWAMLNNGWDLNDEIIWLKKNPQYTEGNRSVRSHEYIFHFVKKGCKDFFYDTELAKKVSDPDGFCVYGTDNRPKFFSGMDFRGNALRTNGANTCELRKQCKEEGFHLTHSATFPLEVPTLLVLLTSKPGDLVVDPFNGTGSVGEVCRYSGRNYVGYELNPQFIMATEVRMNNMSYNRMKTRFNDNEIRLVA